MTTKIIVAGATGNLGTRIVKSLHARGAAVVALARNGAPASKLDALRPFCAELAVIDTTNVDAVAKASSGAACVVSALQGLGEVIVDAQTVLLEGALAGGVKRFIPSDFSTDFRTLVKGENRNFDLRRDFHERLDKADIASTAIFNGAFAEILTYNVPLLDLKKKVVGYWDDADWLIDFTTTDDVAAFTAAAALDAAAPTALRIASFQVSARELSKLAEELFHAPFPLVSLGSRADLRAHNARERAAHPEGEREVYPRWQQSQYMLSMFSAHHEALDNSRYDAIAWSTVRDVLAPLARR